MPVLVGHRAEQLGDATTVVVSSAIREDNPELGRHGAAVCRCSIAVRRWVC